MSTVKSASRASVFLDEVDRILSAFDGFNENEGDQEAIRFWRNLNPSQQIVISASSHASNDPQAVRARVAEDTSAIRTEIADKLIRSLLHESVGLQRVRLWVASPELKGKYHCVAAAVGSKAIAWTSKEEANNNREICAKQYVDLPGKQAVNHLHLSKVSEDIYLNYTLARYENDPYARHQHRSMFGGELDKNNQWLHKDPCGEWIVGPIVDRPREYSKDDQGHSSASEVSLLGFISADNHYPRKMRARDKTGRTDEYGGAITDETRVYNARKDVCYMRDNLELSPDIKAFQRCAVDIVTDILRWLINHNECWFTTRAHKTQSPAVIKKVREKRNEYD